MGNLKIDPSNGGRLNDGRCDRQGRLVCGGYNDMLLPGLKQSSCYQVTPEGLRVRKLLDTSIACANSTCFSPDGTTMYFCDTPERIIWAYDYDTTTGDATNRRDFIDFGARGLDGVPDGSTVDAQGGVWSCNITAGKVTRYDPNDASITCVVNIPLGVTTPTCVALGGKDMTTLFITSLDGSLNQQTGEMEEPRAQEHAGSLFAVDLAAAGLPYSGLPEPLFAY
jgi:L-arabinonolactonase